MSRNLLTFLLAIFALSSLISCARVTNPDKVPKQATLLSKVNSLTLRAGKRTASRRVSSVPQLQCVGPKEFCKLYEVDLMRCTNEGSDYDQENIQWACKASLPEDFKLGSTDVSCEGYESSDDPYVLKGSCGVEYRLLLTELGERKYGSADESWGFPSGKTKSEDYAGYVFMLVFVVVLCIILYSMWNAWQSDSRRPGGRRSGPRGGSGGGFDDDEPPPPYDPYPPRQNPPRKPPQQKTARASSSRSSGGGQQQQGWRPGFWTGAATGAAAGYFAGNRNRSQPETAERRPGGGLFGGTGGGSSWNSRPSGSGSSSSTPSYSSSRHESTGFGSTSRR